jgi:uncharacterized protein YjbJ (UPF0337 family)
MSNIDDAKGRAKEAAGDLTDNDRLKHEGKLDQAKGKVKEGVDKVADAVKDIGKK